MRAELDYVSSDAAALRWACGCVMAGLKERMNAMLSSNSGISRWVLVLEWLMCFTPLTLAWIAGLRFISSYYEHAGLDIYIGTAFGTLGLVALIGSLVETLCDRRLGLDAIAPILAIAFAAMGCLQLVDASASGRLNLSWFKFDPSTFVLFALLPLLGSLHLIHLSRTRKAQPAAA
jgi:hypothetical protein